MNSENRILLSSALVAILNCSAAGLSGGAAMALPSVSGGAQSTVADGSAAPAAPADSTASAGADTSTSTSTSSSSSSSTASSDSTAGGASASGTASGALQGGVAASEQNAESVLVELEETVKHLKDASWGAFTEAQRPDAIFIGGPNVIGGEVIPPVMVTGMTTTGGFLPPRKKWIDYYRLHVNYLGPILKQELDSFHLPAGCSSDTQDDYTEYKRLADRLPDLCSKMLDACAGPKYDNITITMAAGMFNEELKRYDKERKKILKDIKDDYRANEGKEKKEK